MRAAPRLAAVAVLLGSASMLTGCIAAAVAVPVAAAGGIARRQISGSEEREAEKAMPAQAVATTPAPSPTPTPTGNLALIVPSEKPVAPLPPPPPAEPQPGMQYLYGSGEAAAMSIQAYQGLWTYLSARADERKAGKPVNSVVLDRNATLDAPRFVPCAKKPLAVVFDVDETVLLNLGFEEDAARRGTAYDDARWKRWEATGADKVAAVPGAIETIDAARRAGITVVFNSNRSEVNAGGTIAALAIAGLGASELGKTLWLRGEGPGASGKDTRRWAISDQYCVVALVGDQLGDFSDLFNPAGVSVAVRRNFAKETMIASLWGAGWFMLPNPVYGSGLRGDFDDVFPLDKRWTDPMDSVTPTPEGTPAPVDAATPH